MPNPIFTLTSTNPFGLSDVRTAASPTFVDIDGDGDLDALSGNGDGDILFFRNTGTVNSPVFAAAVFNPFGLTDVSYSASPSFVDIDNDGDLDAFVGEFTGSIFFSRNIGTTSNPVFAAATINPFGLIDVGDFVSPVFVDIDNDGDLDAFVGGYQGNTLFFRNTGTASNPVFATASTNPFGLTDVGIAASPSFVDIDGDGDLDALIGNSVGNTLFFRNNGTVSNPVFAAASTNPFGLSKVGYSASPAFVDIDADGDLDAFVGEFSGNTRYFVNNGQLLVSKPGNDVLTGTPSNNDTVTYASATAPITVSLAIGVQQNTGGAGLDTLINIENLVGSSFNDNLIGNTKNNSLNGRAGNDTLDGGVGSDSMIGGLGNDSFVVNVVGDVVTENLNEGTDTVNSSVTYTLPANVENLTLTGASPINGTGNGLINTITGNAANNQLNGGAGNDTINGGIGIDSLTGGIGNDIFRFTTTGQIDTVTDYNVVNDTIQLENAIFTKLTTTGTLAAAQFRIGAQAADSNDFIVYNNITGALSYDANGNGVGAMVTIAMIGVGLNMTNADIVVI
ncbi:MAG TPA: FG-GAP-like repeat-containing protein [Nitrosomonas sp.]|nr:FG-GAP-like repeat-containing protein [Nitrosomonas sp.]